MKKSITVIIKKNNKTTDPRQRIQEVSAGYAFNYLIPKQMAEIATKGKIKHISMIHKIASRNRDTIRNDNIKIKHRLENISSIRIRKKCSANQLIFGSISMQDIAIQISKVTGETVDRKYIVLTESKKLGKHIVKIKIGDSISSSMNLHIIPKTI